MATSRAFQKNSSFGRNALRTSLLLSTAATADCHSGSVHQPIPAARTNGSSGSPSCSNIDGGGVSPVCRGYSQPDGHLVRKSAAPSVARWAAARIGSAHPAAPAPRSTHAPIRTATTASRPSLRSGSTSESSPAAMSSSSSEAWPNSWRSWVSWRWTASSSWCWAAAWNDATAPRNSDTSRTLPGSEAPDGRLPVARRRRQRVRQVVDDVCGAAGAPQPGLLELGAVVGPAYPGGGGCRRVVDHHVAGGGEPHDHQQVPGGRRDRGPGQTTGREGDRGDDRHAGGDERLGLGQRPQPGDEGGEPPRGGVRGVERPIPRALVGGVV